MQYSDEAALRCALSVIERSAPAEPDVGRSRRPNSSSCASTADSIPPPSATSPTDRPTCTRGHPEKGLDRDLASD